MTTFPDDEDLDDNDSQADDDGDDDANSASTSSSSSFPTTNPAPSTPFTAAKATVTVAVHSSLKIPYDPPPPSSSTALFTVLASPISINQRFDTPNDLRKLFQSLWTDEDELLQGFLDYTTQRDGGVVGAGHHDVFYNQIRSKLQLYRNVVNKISADKDVAFKSPHDKATFEISRKIWSNVTATRGPNTEKL